jgi:hypothetical protein
MELVEVDIKLPDDFEAFARSEVQSGRYAYVDEVVVHAFYLLAQDLDGRGLARGVSSNGTENWNKGFRAACLIGGRPVGIGYSARFKDPPDHDAGSVARYRITVRRLMSKAVAISCNERPRPRSSTARCDGALVVPRFRPR